MTLHPMVDCLVAWHLLAFAVNVLGTPDRAPPQSTATLTEAATACDTRAAGYMQPSLCHLVLPPMCAWWCRDLLAA